MDDKRTVARCVIDHLEDGPDGPGFYFTLTDEEDNETDPVGPFETNEQAEDAFKATMEEAVKEMIKQALGLEE